MNKKSNLKKLSVIAMLTAVAYLCVFMFKFKVGFLTFDIKDAFLAIIAFLYGPLYAVLSASLVAFFEFLSISDTGVYGLIMNAISSVAFAGFCGLIYKYKHSFTGAVLGSFVGVVVMTSVMLVANLLITPFYMGVSRTAVAEMIPTLLLPFNLIKGLVNAGVLWILYKPITSVFKKAGLLEKHNITDKKKFGLMTLIALIIIVICLLIVFLYFKGDIVTLFN